MRTADLLHNIPSPRDGVVSFADMFIFDSDEVYVFGVSHLRDIVLTIGTVRVFLFI